MSRLTTIALTAALFATATAASGCGSGDASSGTDSPGVSETAITIGRSVPLSGVAAATCIPMSKAADAWFDHVNDEGGVHGRKIESIVLDDLYQAPQALKNAREFDRKGVFAIFGGCGTIQPPMIQQVAGPKGIPFLLPNASVGELRSGAENAFLLLPPYDLQLGSLTTYAQKEFGQGDVYLIAQQIPGLEQQISAVKKAAEKAGVKVVGEDITTPGQADFTSIVLKVKQAKPDYVVLAQGVDSGRILDAMDQQNALPVKKVLGYSNTVVNTVRAEPSTRVTEKYLAAFSTALPNTPESKSCDDVFKEREPSLLGNPDAAYVCATAQIFVAALEKAGKDLTRETLYDALLSWDAEPVTELTPPLTFTADDHLGLKQMYLVQIEDGKPVVTGELPLTD